MTAALGVFAVLLVCACVVACAWAARSVALAWIDVRRGERIADERVSELRAEIETVRKSVRDMERAAASRPRVRA